MIQKLFERTPIASIVVRCCSIFDPSILVEKRSSVLQKQLKLLLGHLIEHNIFSTNEADKVTNEFARFLETDLKKLNLEFNQFDRKKQRLDDFYFHLVKIQNFESLAFILKLILTLSHGQAAVERLFSINKNVISQNMKPETIVARKTIQDHMISNKLKPESIELSKDLLKSAKSAAQKWKLALEEQKKLEKKVKMKQSQKLFLQTLTSLRLKVEV